MDRVDFFARRRHFVDHLAPVWFEMNASVRGVFYVEEGLVEHARLRGVDAVGVKPIRAGLPPLEIWPRGKGPVVCAAYGDLEQARKANRWRDLILMEHGVGLTPGVGVAKSGKMEVRHDGYAGGAGLRREVALTLATNEFIAERTRRACPDTKVVVVGTPKMDGWAGPSRCRSVDGKPVVAVSFHWDGRVCAEAGNAWEYYRGHLGDLSGKYEVLGHGHPKIIDRLAPVYRALGIEVVRDFEDVLDRADVYVNDCSSTLYEFCVTGKPVVVLNAPWFRRDVDYGIRFWDWCDVGPECWRPEDLVDCVQDALEDVGGVYRVRRAACVRALYPYLGESAGRAAGAIEEWHADRKTWNEQLKQYKG